MHPRVFGIVKSYGLLLALSFMVGIWLSVRRGRARGIDRDTVLDLCFAVLISSLVGVRLFYVLTHLGDFRPWYRVFFIWEGGLTLYGGILLATAVVLWLCRRRRLPFLRVADALAPQVALGIGLTRIGCFLNGCCFGRTTDSALGVVFPPTCEAGAVSHGAPLHPTQLYASAAGFLVWGLLVLGDRRPFRDGVVFARFLLLYGVARALEDLWRVYEPGAVVAGGLTLSQVISGVLATAGLALLIRVHGGGRHGRV
jgi:phosphatidylglycerol---prolipoprotein diacylglyceryl transferase